MRLSCPLFATRWLGFRLDAMCVGLLAACTIGGVAAKVNQSGIDPNMLAVGIMYIIQVARHNVKGCLALYMLICFDIFAVGW